MSADKGAEFVLGNIVEHVTYGAGRVTEITRATAGGRVALVDFGHPIGPKRFLLAFAPLTLVPGGDTRDQVYDYDGFEKDVREKVREAHLRLAVKAAVDAEQRAANPAPPFDAGSVGEILARPAPPPMRIDGLVPSDGGLLVTAARKAGKTSFELNLARSLITGQDFLGRFGVRPIDGDVAILNFEVSGDTLARWADEHGVDRDRCYLVNLRGRRNPLVDADDRQRLAETLRARGTEAVIVDPFGRAFTGKNQNDPGEVGSWLVDLDLFARGEVGATDVVLTAHAGWNGERTRGASALEDWADAIVWITRDQNDDTQRFMRAEGRDVLVEEDQLSYEPATRTLRLTGSGSRKKTATDRHVADLAVFVIRAARQQPGLSYSSAENLIRDMDDAPTFRNGDVAKAARHAKEHGHLHIGRGARGAACLTLLDPTSPDLSRPLPGTAPHLSHLSYRGEVEVGVLEDAQLSPSPDKPTAQEAS